MAEAASPQPWPTWTPPTIGKRIFRDTMRGGKFLNNWRMAQLHAQESPDRVRELEQWGALSTALNPATFSSALSAATLSNASATLATARASR